MPRLTPSRCFINLVTILIGAQMQGDVLYNPSGLCLSPGMVVIMALSMLAMLTCSVEPQGGRDETLNLILVWIVFIIGMIYFFLPLVAVLNSAWRAKRGVYSFEPIASHFSPEFYKILACRCYGLS